MFDSPIKFSSSLSSEDDLLAHQSSEEDVSSDDWMPSDYSPPWSSKKEDLEEEDEDKDKENDADADDDNDDSDDDFDSDNDYSDSDFDSSPAKWARQASYLD